MADPILGRLRDALASLRADQSEPNIDEFFESANAAGGYARLLNVYPVIEQDLVAMQTTIVEHRVFSEGCFDTAVEVVDRMESVISARQRTIALAESMRPSTVAAKQTPTEESPKRKQTKKHEWFPQFKKTLWNHHNVQGNSVLNHKPIKGDDFGAMPSSTVSEYFKACFGSKAVYVFCCTDNRSLARYLAELQKLDKPKLIDLMPPNKLGISF